MWFQFNASSLGLSAKVPTSLMDWSHSSGSTAQHCFSFVKLCFSIAFLMKKLGVNLHCYIDDYMAVARWHEVEQHFDQLCDLLKELGLPINQDKPTFPTRRLIVLGIEIDI